jgi:hypothetical protein
MQQKYYVNQRLMDGRSKEIMQKVYGGNFFVKNLIHKIYSFLSIVEKTLSMMFDGARSNRKNSGESIGSNDMNNSINRDIMENVNNQTNTFIDNLINNIAFF